jgi:acetoin utilization deacetylase AcuC-like enzyme
MGLCVFANVAVAVRAAMLEHGLKKVAIVDWDVHHGNGYEAAFIDDPNVLMVSVHQDLAIAGSGSVEQNGEGEGKGFNINIPLPPGSGPGAYYAAFDRVVLPAVRHFAPDLIVVASGLDAASNDPTARMMLNVDSYRQLTRRMLDVADEVCDGRLVLSHEGGYDATLAPFCALAIFEELSGITSSMPSDANPFDRSGGELNKYQRLMPHQNECIEEAEKLLDALYIYKA